MKRLSILLAGSALAISAQAVNWVEVSESSSGSIFSIDLDSIESSDISIIDEKDVENITVSILRTYPKDKDADKDDSKEEKNSIDYNIPKLVQFQSRVILDPYGIAFHAVIVLVHGSYHLKLRLVK